MNERGAYQSLRSVMFVDEEDAFIPSRMHFGQRVKSVLSVKSI